MARSLIVDVSPLESQNSANAWAARMIGLGNVLGYFIGFLDLPVLTPGLGDTQLKCLCVITISVLVTTVLITCCLAKEEPVYTNCQEQEVHTSPFTEIKIAWKTLPTPIQQICNVQFLAWMGWFPFLFYSTSWVGDTRLGSLALSINSLISLIAGILIPFVQSYTKIPQRNVWAWSMWIFALVVFSSVLVPSTSYIVGCVSALGISWAIALWIPFSLIGEYLNLYTGEYQVLDDVEESIVDTDVKPGIVLGIHNMYICLPEFASTVVSMIIFSLVEKDSFGWAIRVGGVCMFLAGFLALKTTQVKRD